MIVPIAKLTFVSLNGNLHVLERQPSDNLMVASLQFLASWEKRVH
jgi:hypothetical protein